MALAAEALVAMPLAAAMPVAAEAERPWPVQPLSVPVEAEADPSWLRNWPALLQVKPLQAKKFAVKSLQAKPLQAKSLLVKPLQAQKLAAR